MKLGLGIGIGRRRSAPAAGPTVTASPAITGTFEVGETLTCSTGTWAGTGTISYARQWTRNGANISSATGSTYILVEADEGTEVGCRVTATDDLGSTAATAAGAATVTWPAPVAAGLLGDLDLTLDVAMTPVDLSTDFTGGGITFALAPTSASLPAGLTLSSGGGLSGTPTATVSAASIVIRGTNSGGFDDSGFSLTVTDPPPDIDSASILGDEATVELSASGDLYYWITANATETAADVVANGTKVDVTSPTPATISNIDSGLSAGTWYLHLAATDDAETSPISAVTSLSFSVVGITYLGEVAGNSTTTVNTVSLASLSLQENDLVLVLGAVGTANNQTGSMSFSTSGYTSLGTINSPDSVDSNLILGWKRMGASPDANVSLNLPGTGTTITTVVARAYRGVNTTTAMDVTAVTASAANSLLVNPGAITPVTSGAKIVCFGGTGDNSIYGATYSSSDLSNFVSREGGSNNHVIVASGDANWTSGAFDPAAWTFSTSDSTFRAWAAYTVALRPA